MVRGGKLKARKGVNVPDVEIDCAALTAKEEGKDVTLKARCEVPRAWIWTQAY